MVLIFLILFIMGILQLCENAYEKVDRKYKISKKNWFKKLIRGLKIFWKYFKIVWKFFWNYFKMFFKFSWKCLKKVFGPIIFYIKKKFGGSG